MHEASPEQAEGSPRARTSPHRGIRLASITSVQLKFSSDCGLPWAQCGLGTLYNTSSTSVPAVVSPELGLCRHSVNVQEIIRCGFCSQGLPTSEDTKETIMEQIWSNTPLDHELLEASIGFISASLSKSRTSPPVPGVAPAYSKLWELCNGRRQPGWEGVWGAWGRV